MSSSTRDEELLAASLAAALCRGETVAVCTVTSGPATGRRMLVWSAGQIEGDLGWPHLNQRVALHAEQLHQTGPAATEKEYDSPDGRVRVRVEVRRAAGSRAD